MFYYLYFHQSSIHSLSRSKAIRYKHSQQLLLLLRRNKQNSPQPPFLLSNSSYNTTVVARHRSYRQLAAAMSSTSDGGQQEVVVPSSLQEKFNGGIGDSNIVTRTAGDIVTDRILTAAKQAITTGSVQIIQPSTYKQRHSKQKQDIESGSTSRIIRVTTSCTIPTASSIESNPLLKNEIQVHIQPLIVLDLNGILCHRIRRHKQQDTIMKDYPYRAQSGPDIAQTPIIVRPLLQEFVQYMDTHFCVAIWTSAKMKTAKQLISLLIPNATIRNRLLFIWAQDKCEPRKVPVKSSFISTTSSASNTDNNNEFVPSPTKHQEEETIYIKNLRHVWDKFPIWNTDNTLLIDDSPEKCIYYTENAIHPPSLHGRQIINDDINNATIAACTSTPPTLILSDEVNVTQQMEFIQSFVQHWNANPITNVWDSSKITTTTATSGHSVNAPMSIILNNDCNNKIDPNNNSDDKYTHNDMKSFLRQHATKGMGYQIK